MSSGNRRKTRLGPKSPYKNKNPLERPFGELVYVGQRWKDICFLLNAMRRRSNLKLSGVISSITNPALLENEKHRKNIREKVSIQRLYPSTNYSIKGGLVIKIEKDNK